MIVSTHGSTSSAVGRMWVAGVIRSGRGNAMPQPSERLGRAAAVGGDHRDAVDHRLDHYQRLIFAAQRRHQGDLRGPPDSVSAHCASFFSFFSRPCCGDLSPAGGRESHPARAWISGRRVCAHPTSADILAWGVWTNSPKCRGSRSPGSLHDEHPKSVSQSKRSRPRRGRRRKGSCLAPSIGTRWGRREAGSRPIRSSRHPGPPGGRRRPRSPRDARFRSA